MGQHHASHGRPIPNRRRTGRWASALCQIGLSGWFDISLLNGLVLFSFVGRTQIEHNVGRAGEVIQEGITRAEEGVNWLVHEAHEVLKGAWFHGSLSLFIS